MDITAHDFIPLREIHYVSLLVLHEGPLHPYGLSRLVDERWGLRYGPASIHRNVRQLEERSLIRETASAIDPRADDPRRRYFELTPLGREVLSVETERRDSIVTAAKRRLGRT